MKSVKAKEYLESLPRDVLSCYIGMPEVVIAVSLAEQEAEERMRAKASARSMICGSRTVRMESSSRIMSITEGISSKN